MAKKMKTDSVITVAKPVETKNLSGIVAVIATEKAKSMKQNEVYYVTAQLAQTLINKGFATLKEN